MKNININFLIILIAILIFSSCKKELNIYPTTSEVDGQVIVDQKSAQTVLNGIYYRLANVGKDFNNVPTVQWSIVNEDLPSALCGTLTYTSRPWNPSSFKPDYYGADFQWVYGYNIINAANGFIKNISPVTNIPSDIKREMLAEAMFLRAFANTQLLLYYGQFYDISSKYGIILRDQFVASENINLARSTVAQCYDAILNDLNTAIADLPPLNSQVYYANASAAKLLKARVLINRGSAGDYSTVINLTNDIITNGPFALEDSTKDLFLSKGFSSKEVILGIQPYPNQIYKFKYNQNFLSYPVTDTLVGFLKNDPRNQWVYKTVNNYGRFVNQFTKYYSGNPIRGAQTPLSEYCYAFRLTEAYLLEAEAISLSNGNLVTAKTLLEKVLSHAGVMDFTTIENITSPAELQVAIVKEEMKNFVGENGADWFALRRLPISTIKTIQPLLTTVDRYILPIPLAEKTQNGNIIQNPGY
ncbi:MAG: RagB/SusD family nutrient uptake outer membrane protein [Ginsengibacter sp.]